ncbi:helix-turn-helix domain-containing protein [Nocardia sp. NPDC050193]
MRARIVLACAQGLTNADIAAAEGVSLPTAGKWRKRFPDRHARAPHPRLCPPRCHHFVRGVECDHR